MNAGTRVAAFVALLAVIFAGAALAGAALNPEGGTGGARHEGSAMHDAGTAGASARDAAEPAGVASSQDGYRLVADATRFATGRGAPLTFRILDARGAPVRRFDTEQARRMHLIVVRRDMRRYQHLHPTQRADGTWTTSLTLPEAGVYRAFADFQIAGVRHTLGIDLFAPGQFVPRKLPPPQRTARADGYDVSIDQRGRGVMTFSVRRRGLAVTDLQPYLGASGHLVVLRDGDLAYRHVHPLDEPGLAFHTGVLEAGTYRLFLQFRHGDRVHTAAFTRTVRG